MIAILKKIFYFPIASYFRFFAAIRLRRWHPRIIVVTGSNGKTTLLHLLEAQIGDKALYSHHANSSFGVPFHILGLERKTLLKTEWIGLVLRAPFAAFKKLPQEQIYIVEVDCDRPGEGEFLAELLRPEVVLWVSTGRTHSMNFDTFNTVDEAIAYEFGYLLAYCTKLCVINGDSELQVKQKIRTKADVKLVKKNALETYEVTKNGTRFVLKSETHTFPFLLPEESFYAIAMCKLTVDYLQLPFDPSFKHFVMPPGRGSIFAGVKITTLIDSCYNANLSSMTAIIKMYEQFPGKEKWAVIGDMLELGKEEKEEHEKLAELLAKQQLQKIIFLGPRVMKYTYPKLLDSRFHGNDKIMIEKFLGPREVLDYLLENIKGGEIILFKGARFMEGIIEHLLQDKKDAAQLSRREKIWEIRRREWGL